MDLERIENTFDFAVDHNGDLVLTREKTGDLSTVYGTSYIIQQIERRIKESDLEELIGRPNEKEVADEAKTIIINVLTEDNLFSFSDVYVEAIPLTKYSINFFLFVKSPFEAQREAAGEEPDEDEEGEDPLGFEVSLHLSYGAKLRRIV